MSCSKCKDKKYPELSNEPVLKKIAYINRRVVISLLVLTGLAMYGLVTLVLKLI